MNTVILYRSDFAENGISMSWEAFLESVGVETHTKVAGRYIDKEIETVTLTVSNVEAE
jgi:predicted secreted Zn-dependent protease